MCGRQRGMYVFLMCQYPMSRPYYGLFFALLALPFVFTACDTTITGEQLANRPPDTQLSVQDTSLVENLGENLLTSTVHISWSGTDPDGYVAAFEFRYYTVGQRPAPDSGWTHTQRRDSLILLPIPRGASDAQVAFEVRAIDDRQLMDPEPARTVFPIKNSPPSIRLSPFVQPPDTSFNVFSFAWEADDPEGPANLDRIEISFNDTTSFTALPADVDFVTFVAEGSGSPGDQETVSARVYTGRGFTTTDLQVPGLLLNGPNRLYLRAVDATDTSSVTQRYPATEEATWFVREPTSRVLFVNDYRSSAEATIIPYHLQLLKDYLPAGTPVDLWNLSRPYATGSSGDLAPAEALPSQSEPTLRRLLTQWDYIYWVSTDVTGAISGNNLPLTAPVLDLFFRNGGKMMVHVPIHEPQGDADISDNAATLLLPLSGLPVVPDSLRRLQISREAEILPAEPLPGLDRELPPLEAQAFITNALPFQVDGSTIVPLYRAAYTAVGDNTSRPWTGASTVAAISTTNPIALFALPLIQEQSGAPMLAGPSGDPEAAREAVHLILESLGFPN